MDKYLDKKLPLKLVELRLKEKNLRKPNLQNHSLVTPGVPWSRKKMSLMKKTSLCSSKKNKKQRNLLVQVIELWLENLARTVHVARRNFLKANLQQATSRPSRTVKLNQLVENVT